MFSKIKVMRKKSREKYSAREKRLRAKSMLLGFVAGVLVLYVLLSLNSNGISKLSFEKIAIINIDGTITSEPSLFEATTTPDDILPLVEKVNNDISIRGVLIKINSPGGAVVPSRTIAQAIKGIEKPKVCWLGDVAASGAYWIASACDKIIADPLTITGSIGVTASYLQFAKLFDKYGITYERIVSGEEKDMGSPFRNLTEKEREKMEYIINEIFSYFLNDVVKNRNLSEEQVNKIKDGGVFLGKDAVKLGLVDETGTLEDAKDEIKRMSNAANAVFFRLEKRKLSIFDILKL